MATAQDTWVGRFQQTAVERGRRPFSSTSIYNNPEAMAGALGALPNLVRVDRGILAASD